MVTHGCGPIDPNAIYMLMAYWGVMLLVFGGIGLFCAKKGL